MILLLLWHTDGKREQNATYLPSKHKCIMHLMHFHVVCCTSICIDVSPCLNIYERLYCFLILLDAAKLHITCIVFLYCSLMHMYTVTFIKCLVIDFLTIFFILQLLLSVFTISISSCMCRYVSFLNASSFQMLESEGLVQFNANIMLTWHDMLSQPVFFFFLLQYSSDRVSYIYNWSDNAVATCFEGKVWRVLLLKFWVSNNKSKIIIKERF